jgi:hypothetical protein
MDEALHRAETARVLVLGHQPVVQRGQIAQIAVPADPLVDRFAVRLGHAPLPGTAIERAGSDDRR